MRNINWTTLTLHILFFLISIAPTQKSHRRFASATGGGGGRWQLLQPNIGITAMHMQLLKNDRVVIFDRTDFGQSNLSLPNGKCRDDSTDMAVTHDCTAHSVEYDVVSNTFRPLMVQTDVWCSSGSVIPDGRLIQTGGFNDGENKVRIFTPCDNCDWEEIGAGLNVKRWYSTNHILPDGRQIIIGGRKQFNYEFYPKTTTTSKTLLLPFLVQTNDYKIENNLYPFVHLINRNLFIFANNRAILFDYVNNKVLRNYPSIPNGHPRNYPSTGSSVLLAIENAHETIVEAEVLICGGAPNGSYAQANNSANFVEALNTCGRIKITDPNPKWVMETMPLSRVMGDMVTLPNGNVLIINGTSAGTAGWEFGRNPVLQPVLYRPDGLFGSRFEILNPTVIPRMYHSSAILLRDGRVLIGGSNPHVGYVFTGVLFPTELRLEAFSPSYLDQEFSDLKPEIVSFGSQSNIKYGQKVEVVFKVSGNFSESSLMINMVAPSFATHSFSMNQRLLVLKNEKPISSGKSIYRVQVSTPISSDNAPPGYYLLFVVHQDIPSEGVWINIS